MVGSDGGEVSAGPRKERECVCIAACVVMAPGDRGPTGRSTRGGRGTFLSLQMGVLASQAPNQQNPLSERESVGNFKAFILPFR